jgi:hypothetical protein
LKHWTEIQTCTEVAKAVGAFREDLEEPMTCASDNNVLNEVNLSYIN